MFRRGIFVVKIASRGEDSRMMSVVTGGTLRGLVLAGGMSTRMGRNKAELEHRDGRRLARRCHDLLRDAGCGQVTLSLRPGQEVPAGFEDVPHLRIVRDGAEEASGPISGVAAAMRECPDHDWLVVACDLPGLDAESIAGLIAARAAGARVVAYRRADDGLPEPLCAIYGTDSREAIEAEITGGGRSLRRVLDIVGARLLAPARGALENINDPHGWSIFSATVPPVWTARLEAIYLSEGHDFKGRHGQSRLEHGIRPVDEVECVAGFGLRGDRYFGFKPDFKGQVTFFDAAVADAVRGKFNLPDLGNSVFRRNLVTRGVDLGEWIGRRFIWQGVEFEGSEECKPCYWMDEAVAPGVEEFLKENSRGGLRARVVTGGWLRVG